MPSGRSRPPPWPRRGPVRGRSAPALASLLAVPAWASARAIQHHTTDTNRLGVLPPRQLAALSAYLRSHQGSARYEAAYDEATQLGSLVVRDTSARWWC